MLLQEDIDYCVRGLPAELGDELHEHPNLVIAGGYMRWKIANEKASDIDVFAPTAQEAKEAAARLAKKLKATVITTDNACTLIGDKLPFPIQFIHKWTYGTPGDVIQSFDFTISQAAIYFASNGQSGMKSGMKWQSVCSDRFYADLAAKRLVYAGSNCPGGTMLRMAKFLRRGYRISPENMAGIVTDVAGEASSIDASKGESMRTAILGLLRSVDPLVTGMAEAKREI